MNIAKRRFIAMKARTAQFSPRDASRSSSLKVEPLILRDVSEESAVVFDIGVARDAQRFRRRANARPITISQRAKVIRSGENQGRALAVVGFPEPRRIVKSSPRDLPPAA